VIGSRRDFLKNLAGSFAVLSFCELAVFQKAMASAVSPILIKWLNDVNDLARSIKEEKITQVEWQNTMAALYNRLPLSDLLKYIDFEKLVLNSNLPKVGESFEEVIFPKIEGLPENTYFYKDMAGFRKGNAIPPHGHNHLVSSFLVLEGDLHGRHFDRLSDNGDFINVRPTINQTFSKGQFSSISQNKDNIHWFTSLTDNSFIMDFGVWGLKPADTTKALPHQHPFKKGRVYLDVSKGSKISEDGRDVRVKRISETDAYSLYGIDQS